MHFFSSEKVDDLFCRRPQGGLKRKKMTLALSGVALGVLIVVLGVHLQIFRVNYAQHFFLRPGGAGAPAAPPGWLRLCKLQSKPKDVTS